MIKTLYHGTSSVNLSSIRELGLLPGHAKGGDAWANLHMPALARKSAKREPSVFLADTAADAENFARYAVQEMGGDPILVVLHVPQHVFETYAADEMFDSSDLQHAWKAHSVDPTYIARIVPVAPRDPMELALESLLEAMVAHQRA